LLPITEDRNQMTDVKKRIYHGTTRNRQFSISLLYEKNISVQIRVICGEKK